MKQKKIILGCLIAVVLTGLFAYGYNQRRNRSKENVAQEHSSNVETKETSVEPEEKPDDNPYIAADDVPAEEEHPTITYNNFTWDAGYEGAFENTRRHMRELTEDNYDIYGWMLWDTGMVQEEIMKTNDNEKYLDHAANGGTTDKGQPFFDKAADLKNDQVITVYSYSTGDVARLGYVADILGIQENYEHNKTFLVEYDDFADWFQVDCVFDLSQVPEFEINKRNFKNKEDFKNWYTAAKEASTIDSGLKANDQNHFMVMSLQTSKDKKFILLAKRLKRYYYKDCEKTPQ